MCGNGNVEQLIPSAEYVEEVIKELLNGAHYTSPHQKTDVTVKME